MREERDREREREEILRILRRHVQTSFWKATPFHGRSFERLEKAIVLSPSLFLSLSLLFSFCLGSFLDAWFDCSFTIDRDTSARRCKFLLVRSFVPSLFLPRMKTNIFLRDASIREDFSQSNGIIRLFFFFIKNFPAIEKSWYRIKMTTNENFWRFSGRKNYPFHSRVNCIW